MKFSHLFIPSALILSGLLSCSKKENNTDAITITIQADSVVNQMQAGIGANFTSMVDSLPVVQLEHQYRSYGGSCWGANPILTDTASWNKIWNYADWMGMDFCRLLTTRKAFEPEKGKFTFESAEMKMLYNYLDYCQSRGVDVFLQNFANNVKWLSVPTAGNDPIKILRSAPNDEEAYTDGLLKLVEHLVKVKKYTCVKYLCITNEPFENWSWYIARFDPDSFASPAPAYKLMQQKLAASNLGVKLSGPDVSVYLSTKVHPERFDYFNSFDAYDVHSYVTREDWCKDSTMTFEDGGKGEINKIKDTEVQYASWKKHAKANNNKPLFISEMGSFMYGFGQDTIGMSTYDAMMKDVQSVVRYSNVGLDGFMRWSFLNRGNLDGQWQFVHTWDMKKGSLLPANEIKPHSIPFYTWGLLTRFTPKNAKIIFTEVKGGAVEQEQRVFAATYQSPTSDDFTICIINDSEKAMPSSIILDKKSNKPLQMYQVDENKLKGNFNSEVSIEPTTIDLKNALQLPAKSITIITSYQLKNSDKGIITQ